MKIECLAGAACLALVLVSGRQAKSASPITIADETSSAVAAPVAVPVLHKVRDVFHLGHQILAAGTLSDTARCVATNGQTRAYYSLSCFDQALPAKLRSR